MGALSRVWNRLACDTQLLALTIQVMGLSQTGEQPVFLVEYLHRGYPERVFIDDHLCRGQTDTWNLSRSEN